MFMKIFKLTIISIFFSSVSLADKNMKIGSKGKLSEVDRVIKVKMYDNYYEPKFFNIKKGETIKFEVVKYFEFSNNVVNYSKYQTNKTTIRIIVKIYYNPI